MAEKRKTVADRVKEILKNHPGLNNLAQAATVDPGLYGQVLEQHGFLHRPEVQTLIHDRYDKNRKGLMKAVSSYLSSKEYVGSLEEALGEGNVEDHHRLSFAHLSSDEEKLHHAQMLFNDLILKGVEIRYGKKMAAEVRELSKKGDDEQLVAFLQKYVAPDKNVQEWRQKVIEKIATAPHIERAFSADKDLASWIDTYSIKVDESSRVLKDYGELIPSMAGASPKHKKVLAGAARKAVPKGYEFIEDLDSNVYADVILRGFNPDQHGRYLREKKKE